VEAASAEAKQAPAASVTPFDPSGKSGFGEDDKFERMAADRAS
jgi:hypothetical protein